MRRSGLILAAVLAASPPAAETLDSGASSCGGNAYSSAQVIENRPPRRGPITSVPDTLCADVEAPHGSSRIEIYGVPGFDGGRGPEAGPPGAVGQRPRSAPYDDGAGRAGPQGPARRGD